MEGVIAETALYAAETDVVLGSVATVNATTVALSAAKAELAPVGPTQFAVPKEIVVRMKTQFAVGMEDVVQLRFQSVGTTNATAMMAYI